MNEKIISLWKKLFLWVWIIVRGCRDGGIVMACFLNSGRLYKQRKKRGNWRKEVKASEVTEK